MFRKLLGKLGEQTSIAIVLRKIVELNFRKQKSAIKHFLSLPPGERILDVGCGSGLFSLAAIRLGAKNVFSFDYDNDSVTISTVLKDKYAANTNTWKIEHGDVLDLNYLCLQV